MLPPKVTDLTNNFVRAYEAEHPVVIEIRKAQQRAAESAQTTGMGFSLSNIVPRMAMNLTALLQERADFIWNTLKEVLSSAEIVPYPDLNTDLISKIEDYFNPARRHVETQFEQMRQSANCPTGFTTQFNQQLDNILLRLKAKVALFCEEYTVAHMKKNQSSQLGSVNNIENFTGILGDVLNSNVTISDYSSIHNWLKKSGVAQDQRNQLENIMDEIDAASPQRRKLLLEQGKAWVVKHKELLGAGAEIVMKAIQKHTELNK